MARLPRCIKTEENVQVHRSVSKSLFQSLCRPSALSKLFCFRVLLYSDSTSSFTLSGSVWPLSLFHSLQSDRQLLTLGVTPWVLDPKPAMSVLNSRAPDVHVSVCTLQWLALLKGKITAFKDSEVSTCSRPDPSLAVVPHIPVIGQCSTRHLYVFLFSLAVYASLYLFTSPFALIFTLTYIESVLHFSAQIFFSKSLSYLSCTYFLVCLSLSFCPL